MVREQKQTRVLNLSEPAVLGVDDEETKEKVSVEVSHEIPPKNLLNIGVRNLKNLKGYREIRIAKKKEKMINEFIEQFNPVLDELVKKRELKYEAL